MSTPKNLAAKTLAVVAAVLISLTACKVNVNKDEEKKQVDIRTPVGGIHVSKGVDVRDFGVAVYPGARPKQESDGNKGANVHFSSPYFGLRVAVQEFESDDPAEKLVRFYAEQLRKYGKVIECHGEWKDGNPPVTIEHGKDKRSHDLTCDKDSSGNAIELKAGTDENQHIVAIEPQARGCKFALVRVELRGEGDTI